MHFQVLQKNELVISRDTSSYPILLDEVKMWCEISLQNTQKDTLIQNKIIPTVVDQWENKTRFFLLDTQRKGILNSQDYAFCKVRLEALNVREILEIEYYPASYEQGPASFLDIANDITFEHEINATSAKVYYKNRYLALYKNFKNKLSISYQAGYENNDFSNMPKKIKNALLEMCYNEFHKAIGSCKESLAWSNSAIKQYSLLENDLESIYIDKIISYFESGMLY